jgi:hypothetical protein
MLMSGNICTFQTRISSFYPMPYCCCRVCGRTKRKRRIRIRIIQIKFVPGSMCMCMCIISSLDWNQHIQSVLCSLFPSRIQSKSREWECDWDNHNFQLTAFYDTKRRIIITNFPLFSIHVSRFGPGPGPLDSCVENPWKVRPDSRSKKRAHTLLILNPIYIFYSVFNRRVLKRE